MSAVEVAEPKQGLEKRKSARINSADNLTDIIPANEEESGSNTTKWTEKGKRMMFKNVHVHKGEFDFFKVGHTVIVEENIIIGVIPNDSTKESGMDEQRLYNLVVDCEGGYIVSTTPDLSSGIRGCGVKVDDPANLIVYDKNPMYIADGGDLDSTKQKFVLKQGVILTNEFRNEIKSQRVIGA
jgi:hypothetical protein